MLTGKSWPAVMALILLVSHASAERTKHAGGQSIMELVGRLRTTPWRGPRAVASPLEWDFGFTELMQKILDIGAPAQDAPADSKGRWAKWWKKNGAAFLTTWDLYLQ